MPDNVTQARRSQIMAAVRSEGNKGTELKLAALFRANGITGWRRQQALPGKPDFVFWRQRLAVFVDGCFWHGCPKHLRLPATHARYWRNKIARNRARDKAVARLLRQRGWRVARAWEHALRRPAPFLRRLQRQLSAGNPPPEQARMGRFNHALRSG
jgi:DNA mismatch endonuclease (patch repair protein)